MGRGVTEEDLELIKTIDFNNVKQFYKYLAIGSCIIYIYLYLYNFYNS